MKHPLVKNSAAGAIVVTLKIESHLSAMNRSTILLARAVIVLCAATFIFSISVFAQDPNSDPQQPTVAIQDEPQEITAVPNRPTFATTAETVQRGVFEIEYGMEAASGRQNVNGVLKFGIVKNLELWFTNVPLERDSGIAGLGDSAAGFKYKFISQNKALPSIAIFYLARILTLRPMLEQERWDTPFNFC
jgi:hypothetical protein